MKLPLLSLALSLLALGAPSVAEADLSDCGNIAVEADAMCTVEVDADCDVQCEPIAFKAACAADLYVGCEGGCDVTADVSCTSSCTGTCMADCEADPGKFDCRASCEADAEASCAAQCTANDDQAGCEASCRATFAARCSANCDAVAPTADCEAQCNGCCTGECEAEINAECQIDCQASGYVDCEADLQGGCEAACESPEGALFCDGNYVDHDGNLASCVAALEALIDIEVDASATGSANCEGGACEAKGDAKAAVGCAVSRSPTRPATWLGFVIGGLLVLTRRRRTR